MEECHDLQCSGLNKHRTNYLRCAAVEGYHELYQQLEDVLEAYYAKLVEQEDHSVADLIIEVITLL